MKSQSRQSVSYASCIGTKDVHRHWLRRGGGAELVGEGSPVKTLAPKRYKPITDFGLVRQCELPEFTGTCKFKTKIQKFSGKNARA